MIGHFELIYHNDTAFLNPFGESTFHRQLLDLGVNLLVIAARFGSESDTAAGPDRTAATAGTGTTGSFLAERLGAAAADLRAGLGAGSAGTLFGKESHHGVVNGLFTFFQFNAAFRKLISSDYRTFAVIYIQFHSHF